MKISGNICTAVLIIFLLLIASSTADIISMKLQSDNRHAIEFSEFNFTHTGYVSITISYVLVISNLSQPNLSRIGFFLLSDDVLIQHRPEFLRGPDCILDFKLISILLSFEDLFHHHWSSFSKSYPVTYPGKNTLYLVNCNDHSQVTMDVRTELYNTDGTTKDYLSAGLRQLPSLYFIFSLIYLCFLAIWIFLLFKNQRCVHKMHLLMGVLLVITVVYFICAAANRYYVKVTGTPHGWDVLFYMFQLIKTVLSFTMIVLIGTGWCFRKQMLERREKFVLWNVIILQILSNVSFIMAGLTSSYPEDLWNWKVDTLLEDSFSCAIMFLPIYWSIMSLREACETDGNAARGLAKLYVFFMVAFGYVFITRILISGIVVSGLAPHVVHKGPWVFEAAKETGNLLFCMVLFYLYRPVA